MDFLYMYSIYAHNTLYKKIPFDNLSMLYNLFITGLFAFQSKLVFLASKLTDILSHMFMFVKADIIIIIFNITHDISEIKILTFSWNV